MIDPELLTAHDFIGVRAGLVAALGHDANRAVILTRIHFRCIEGWRESHLHDGEWWWRATYETIAQQTGLSVKQVERCLKWLIDHDHLIAQRFALNGSYDQTRSYRVNTDPAKSGDDSPIPGNVESAKSGNVPLTKKKEETLGGFDLFWQAYPRKVNKVAAVRAWNAAMKKGVTAEEVTLAAARYARKEQGTEEKFIAHASSWLNQERWNDYPAVTPKPNPNAWMDRSVPPSYFEGKK